MAKRKRVTQPQKTSMPRWWPLALGGLAVAVALFVLLRSPAEVTAPTLATATVTATFSTKTTAAAISTAAPAASATAPASTPAPQASPSAAASTPANAAPITYTYRVVNSYPHDGHAFTQGLIYLEGIFYEGTGLKGHSTLRKVAVETGEVLQRHQLPPDLFGEGITVFGDRLIQLTWQARRGFEYNKDTFELTREFTYPTEGWGITHNGEKLIMSDGTDTLYFWDPTTFEEIGRVQVFDAAGPVVRLNELEYINGEVFANVWQTNRIARINPDTGQVTGWIDLTGLLSAADRTEPVDVLNGIAYDAATDRLFVTGKFWPKLFEIELVPQGGGDGG